uniref:Uncharacterized protein n=1 Tax=Caenorhabditis japonica TaxID=281687 RepID=A0A8R1EIR7_CAEJA
MNLPIVIWAVSVRKAAEFTIGALMKPELDPIELEVTVSSIFKIHVDDLFYATCAKRALEKKTGGQWAKHVEHKRLSLFSR